MGQTASLFSSNHLTLDMDNILQKIENKDYKKKKFNSDYYITHYNGSSFIVLDNKDKKELKIFQNIYFTEATNNSDKQKYKQQITKFLKLLKVLGLKKQSYSQYYLKIDKYCFIYNYAFPNNLTLFSDELKPNKTTEGYIFDENTKFNNHFIKYNELLIGHDVLLRNEYIYKTRPLFGKGNTLLVQDKKNKFNEYSFIFGEYVLDKEIILEKDEKILYYYSPIGNNDVSDTIIITNKKIFCNSDGGFLEIPFSKTEKSFKEINKICSSKLKSPLDVKKYKYKDEFIGLIEKIIDLGFEK
jgi:hypothetical protein